MYRFLAHLRPDAVQAIAAQAYMEMLESGFTRVGEFHYLHHDADGRPYANRAEMSARIAAAADQTGIGLTLLPVFYAHADFGGAPPNPAQRRLMITWPCSTRSPTFTSMRDRCRKLELTPKPWSSNSVPPVRYRSGPAKVTMPAAGAFTGVPVGAAMSMPE